MAAQVTAKGREILSSMLAFLEKAGANVIEMDTDGIYFQPPESLSEDALQSQLQASLPKGIEVELDNVYDAMFCYKSKNYALLKASGEISITGAALKSRGLEPFQRDCIEEAVALLLRRDHKGYEELFARYRAAISGRKLPLSELAKSETLSDSLDTYKRKMASGEGRRSAAYELALKSGRDYRQGDQVSFYITGAKKKVSVVDNSKLLSAAGDARDENVDYYLDKLEELRKKFSAFAGDAAPDDGQGLLF
jgi:DNA polymerase elongation subunit (family B)